MTNLVLWWLAQVSVASAQLASMAKVQALNEHPVTEFDFFRAMPSVGIGTWMIQNFNLAGVPGVAKYLHTEVVAEHVIGNPGRKARKNGIDAIARMRFKVKNPGDVLASGSPLATQVDFGPFTAFDKGVATNPQSQKWIQEFGGFVGVQHQMDWRWPYTEPYFWFSVTGWCPNVQYDRIRVSRAEYQETIEHRSKVCGQLRSTAECRQFSEDCLIIDGDCVARDPAPECLNHSKYSKLQGHVLGGLCPGGNGTSEVVPTGEPGCTYTYAAPEQVSLDEIAGIVDEDCGGRRCTDWLDFRHNCSNNAYRRVFDPWSRKTVPYKYCVEYDVNPACQSDCSNPACRALSPADKEIGVPFWQGKCDEYANRKRVLLVQQALGVAVEHKPPMATRSLPSPSAGPSTCVYSNPGACTPAYGQGGNYCSRHWDGVCTHCFIPGTLLWWPASAYMAYCPYNILRTDDYRHGFEPPNCMTSRARDLCCLYTGTCTAEGTDPWSLPLDDDGLVLAASWANSSAMAVFLERSAQEHSLVRGVGDLVAFADSQWDTAPQRGASLERALEVMMSRGLFVNTTAAAPKVRRTTSSQTYGYAFDMPMVVGTKGVQLWPFLTGIISAVLVASIVTALLLWRIQKTRSEDLVDEEAPEPPTAEIRPSSSGIHSQQGVGTDPIDQKDTESGEAVPEAAMQAVAKESTTVVAVREVSSDVLSKLGFFQAGHWPCCLARSAPSPSGKPTGQLKDDEKAANGEEQVRMHAREATGTTARPEGESDSSSEAISMGSCDSSEVSPNSATLSVASGPHSFS